MNIKVKKDDLEIEMTHVDVAFTEKFLTSFFTLIEGGSFTGTFASFPSNHKQRVMANFVPDENGMKNLNGTKVYKTRYSCSGCGKHGTRYVKDTDTTTSCHGCKTELTIVPATENDAHDEEFNYFVAY